MSQATLFHISDLHFGAEDRAALAWFMAEAGREGPAAVICTGDLTMRGTPREFALAQDWLGALPVPVTLEPGNHDVPYYHHMWARLTRPFHHYRALEAAVEARLDLPGVAVVPLNTVGHAQWRLNWSKGRIARADLAETISGLGAQAGKPLRLVAGHHPLVDADTQGTGSTRGGRAALAELAAAGADAVLSGHVHDPFDLTVHAGGRPIRLIGAGTLSTRLRVSPPSYNRLEWSEAQGLRVQVVTMA